MFRPLSVIIRFLTSLLKGVTYLEIRKYVTLFNKEVRNLMMTDTGRNM